MAKAKQFDRVAQKLKNKLPREGFFSTLDEMIDAAPFERVPARQWKAYLQPGKLLEREGVKFPLKKEELEYSGFNRWFEELDDEAKDAAMDKIALREMVQRMRPEFDSTETSHRFNQYAHPVENPTDYSESVTNSPDFGEFSTHFFPTTISHSRRTLQRSPQNERIHLIEEIQSDRHQRGREKGYRGVDSFEQATERSNKLYRLAKKALNEEDNLGFHDGDRAILEITQHPDWAQRWDISSPESIKLIQDWLDSREEVLRLAKQVPEAPFKDPSDYGTLELKTQLLDAIDNDADFLALARGADQTDRYPGMKSESLQGMNYTYDQVYPSALRKLAKRYSSDLEEVKAQVKGPTDEPETLREHELDFPDFMEATEEALQEPILPRHRLPIEDLLDEFRTSLPDREDLIRKVEDSLKILKQGGDSELMEQAWEPVGSMMDSLYRDWKSQVAPSATIEKTFPAIRLTPQMKELIKKAGVPLWALSAVGVLPDEEERYADGGKVKKRREGSLEKISGFVKSLGAKGQLNRIRRQQGLKELPDQGAEDRARLVLGLLSQIYGLDDQGEAVAVDKDEFLGLNRPGIVDETMALPTLLEAFGITDSSPEWATKAAERTERLRNRLQERMGVDDAHGLKEHLIESLGVMAGQLPIPGSLIGRLKKPVEALKNIPELSMLGPLNTVRRTVQPAVEWLSPTVDPKLKNYLIGGSFGGVLGALGDEPEDLTTLAEKYNAE